MAKEARVEITTPVVRDCVFRAIHSFADADKRWKKRLKKQMDDKELTEAISYELGIQGGHYGPGRPAVDYKGGTNPHIEIRDCIIAPKKRILLKKFTLLRMVRTVLHLEYIKKGKK